MRSGCSRRTEATRYTTQNEKTASVWMRLVPVCLDLEPLNGLRFHSDSAAATITLGGKGITPQRSARFGATMIGQSPHRSLGQPIPGFVHGQDSSHTELPRGSLPDCEAYQPTTDLLQALVAVVIDDNMEPLVFIRHEM